tara:strand:- start:452 stop:733 length:282 start_codon:yes stop_codon:yes gene_type:complete
VIEGLTLELVGIDTPRTFSFNSTSFKPLMFEPQMVYYFMKNETTVETDMILDFKLGTSVFVDGCYLQIQLPISIGDPGLVLFWSKSELFSADG